MSGQANQRPEGRERPATETRRDTEALERELAEEMAKAARRVLRRHGCIARPR